MCPSIPEVRLYYGKLAQRLTGVYRADGFKVDGMYVCPPCFNPGHHHQNPNEASQDYYKVFEAFYSQAKSINRQVTIMSCPCGSICDFTSLPYITETIAADPENLKTVRRNAKLYRALKGADTPFSSDYIDIEEETMIFPNTLATAIGAGTVPQAFFGASPSPENLKIYKKWFALYAAEMISQAQYLNLYDICFDKPETHVFKKTSNRIPLFYYSFYMDDSRWNGTVELRGLDPQKKYLVYDYVNQKEMGIVSGESPYLSVSFEHFLLVKCREK